MSILRTTRLVAGHYECRSLSETLSVFTDLLAMEIVEQKAREATLKHPNTDWRLIVHEGGPNTPEKTFDNHHLHIRLLVPVEERLHLVEEPPARVHNVKPQLGGAPIPPRGEGDGRYWRAFSSC